MILIFDCSEVRVGGMLSGKAGKAYFHVGSGKSGLQPLWEVAERTSIPITQMYPTHVSSRGPALWEDSKKWVNAGGVIDLTADSARETHTVEALLDGWQNQIPLEQVTVSSDAYGSFPVFSEDKTKVIQYGVAPPSSLLHTLKQLVLKHKWPIERALPLFTSNPASFLQFSKKGHIQKGSSADILLLDKDFNLLYVYSNGNLVKTPTFTKNAMFPRL